MGIGSALQTLFKEWFVAGWLRNKGEASSSTGTVHAATPVPVPSYIITQHTEQAISPQGHQWNPYLKIKQYLKEFRKNSIAQP